MKRHDYPLSPTIKKGEAFALELKTENGKIAASVNGREAGNAEATWKSGPIRFGITPSSTELIGFRNVAVRMKAGG